MPARRSQILLGAAAFTRTRCDGGSQSSCLDVSDLARLKQLEDENYRMRRVISNLTLENDAMKELATKNSWRPRSAKKP